jgi:prepilin-type N-terminal cleavage/methylation domain-containing protein
MTDGSYIMNHGKLFFPWVVGRIDSRPGGTADNKGFSLVELITVVLIIAALSAMVIPSYNNYINKSKNARAMSEIRTLTTEISAWSLDHNNTNPPNLAAIGRDNYLDPWKRPYEYKTIPVLEDPFGARLLNTDFDIYSKGIDGAGTPVAGDPGNKDDIVRSNDGAFVGLREMF